MSRFLIKSLLVGVCLYFISCNEESQDPDLLNVGHEYFPVTTGLFWVYQIEEIAYNTQGPDSNAFYMRISISDSLIAGDGTITYILSLEQGQDTSTWMPYKTWSARRTSRNGVVVEENIPYIKLAFPLEDGKTWNGNALNTKQEKIYRLSRENYVMGDELFDAFRVITSDVEANLVEQDEQFEIYVPGIGLVERNQITLQFCTVNCEGAEQIESGLIWSQLLIDYGKN